MTSHTGTANAVPAIGDCISGGDSGYDGAIQDFVITNDALTAAEVLSLASGSVASVLGSSGNNQKIHYPLTTNFNDAVSSGGLGNGTASGNAAINTTIKGKEGDCLAFNMTGTADDMMYYDLQQALGANANATDWTVRMKINVTTKSGTTSNGTQFVIGLSSSNAFAGARDFMGVEIVQSHNTTAWNTMNNATVNAGYPQNNLDSTGEYLGGSGNTIDLASGTDWWLDITRDGDACTCTLYTDEFSGTSYAATVTTSSITDLRYIFFGSYSTEATFVGNIDDIKFYDGGMTQDEKATLVTDSLGSTLDATNSGATADSATAINGKASLTFDNSNDWINLGTGLNSSIDGKAFSISAWVYVSSTSLTDATIIGKQIAGYSSPYHVFNVRAHSGNWSFTTNDGSNYQGDTTTAISHTGWTHIVATFDGTSSFKVYADNVEVCSYSNANTNWSNSYWSLGNGEGTTRWWDSEIQDVAVWSRVLTSGERTTLLNSYAHGTATSSGNTGKVATDISTTGLLAYYTLNDTTTGVTNSAKVFDLPENTLFDETDTYNTWWLQDDQWKGEEVTFDLTTDPTWQTVGSGQTYKSYTFHSILVFHLN